MQSVFDGLSKASSWLITNLTFQIVSHGAVGKCNINDELYSSDENKRFVLHDSMGFEPGDEGHFDMVIKFLNDRKKKPDIKDQVHAVWCENSPNMTS